MLKLLHNNNGVKLQALTFPHHFHPFLLYSTTRTPEPSFATYLVETLGFTHPESLSTSTKLTQYRQSGRTHRPTQFTFSANADSVIAFFRNHGFSNSHIRSVIRYEPRLLLANVEKTLLPKFHLLKEIGFSKENIVDVVSGNPKIIVVGSGSAVLPAVRSLREVMGSESDVISVIKKSHWHSLSGVSKYLLDNVGLLREFGVGIESIRSHLVHHPLPFLRKPEIFKEFVKRVEEKLGISRHSGRFLSGIHLVSGLSEKSIEGKYRVFESFGWSQSQIMEIVRRNPYCLALSEARIKRSLVFLTEELAYEPEYIASRPNLLASSLDKRILPRHRVFLVLKEKGLMKMDCPFFTAIFMTESRFMKKFVLPFEEVHEVYAKHTGRSLPLQLEDE